MNKPLSRIRNGAIALASVFIFSVLGFRLLGGYGWLEAVWMVVITISTVGYSESTDANASMQMLMIVVILLGVTAAAYTFGGFLQLMLEGEIDRVLGRRKNE